MTLSTKAEVDNDRNQKQSDQPWINAARQGDVTAWEHLVRQYEQPVFRLAYLILANVEDAEEVAQEAFVRAFQSLATFDENRPFQPWLMQITHNLARNRQRSLGRYWAAIQRWRQKVPVAETAVPDSQDAQLLWQAVQRLRPAAQEIIYLRYFLEFSEAETAAILDIKKGTAKSRLSRALNQLRNVINMHYTELKDF